MSSFNVYFRCTDSSREQIMGGRGREKHVVIVKGERGILVTRATVVGTSLKIGSVCYYYIFFKSMSRLNHKMRISINARSDWVARERSPTRAMCVLHAPFLIWLPSGRRIVIAYSGIHFVDHHQLCGWEKSSLVCWS